MTAIDPDELRVGDVVTMRDTFIITEITGTHIWAGPVSYSKRSAFQSVLRFWALFPVPVSARPAPPQWPQVERRVAGVPRRVQDRPDA